MENKDKDGNVIVPAVEVDVIAEKDAYIKRIETDLGNYRNVALKRLGKLPGDADFMKGADESTGLTVEETIKKTLLEGEYARTTAEKDEYARKLFKENSELKLALKNRPETSIGGGDSTSTVVTKDNVLTPEQETEILNRAKMLNVKDPQAFLEQAKKNLLAKR